MTSAKEDAFKKKKYIDQMVMVLEAERDNLLKMVDMNKENCDDEMAYVLFSWLKFADAMGDVVYYFKNMSSREDKI